jgi:hypothetical protein
MHCTGSIPANGPDEISSHHDGGMGKWAHKGQDPVNHLVVLGKLVDDSTSTLSIDNPNCRPYYPNLRMSLKKLILATETVQMTYVIRIHSCQITPNRFFKSFVETADEATIGIVPYGPDPLIADLLNDAWSPIRRTIVDDEQLEIFEGLMQNAINRLIQIIGSIKHAKQYSDFRHRLRSCNSSYRAGANTLGQWFRRNCSALKI